MTLPKCLLRINIKHGIRRDVSRKQHHGYSIHSHSMSSEKTSQKHDCVMYTPLYPKFIIAKLGYAWVYLSFLFLLQNIHCGYSLEPPW